MDDFDKALSVLKSAIDARKVDRAQQDRNEGEIATSHAPADASGGPPRRHPKPSPSNPARRSWPWSWPWP